MCNYTVKRACIVFLLIFMVLSAQGQGSMSLPNACQDNWKRAELEDFSFRLPPNMTQRDVRAVDSLVWVYSSNSLELNINSGLYAGGGSDDIEKEEPEYREVQTKIDGKKATMVFFRDRRATDKNLPYVAAVYFSNIWRKGMHLSFLARCASPQDQAIAKQIFLSIDFK